MLNLLLYAVLLAPVGRPQARPTATPPAPVDVSKREASRHCLDPESLYLRLPEKPEFDAYLEITVTVDQTGTVISARADPTSNNQQFKDSPALLAQAASMVGKVRYSPFTRGGRPVSAQFTENVFLLPPEIKPVRHVPFPRVKDWNSVRIGLSRSGCYGTCPAYSVEIGGNGSVTYDGRGFVTFTGHHRAFISPHDVVDLVKQFEKADFYSLSNEYAYPVTDNPFYTLSISIDGVSKQVEDYVGLQTGMPMAVSRLEAEVDRVSGSERWTKGNADTVAALEAEHWDFKSPEAAAALIRAAERANAEVVRDLVQDGVSLTAPTSQGTPVSEYGRGLSSALAVAGSRGDPEMLRALLEAGAAADVRGLNDAVVAAARSGNVEAYRLLLSYGAPSNPRDSLGITALMAAASSGYPAMVRELLHRHADPNAGLIVPRSACRKDPDCEAARGGSRTPLMEAVRAEDYGVPPEGVGRAEVVRLLLAAGADVNARDRKGNTALILCSNSARQAELLLKAGADPNARNLEGDTALDQTYRDDVKRVLRTHGAIEVKAEGDGH